MIQYGRQSIDDSDVEAVVSALRSDWLTTGPAVDRFEADVSRIAGAMLPAVAVTSGTAALHTAYRAARVGPGTEVVTTPLTFAATAATAALLGATVRFADVDEKTGNLDPDAAAAAVTRRTAVIAGVDYAGVPVDASRLSAVARSADAVFLEDAAHSIGSFLNGVPVGSLADITTFSFFPTKNATTAEGGAVVTSDSGLWDRARAFRNHGLVREAERQRHPDEGPWHQEVADFGLNYRMPDVLAALGSSQLLRLTLFKSRRAAIFDRYRAGLSGIDGLSLPSAPSGADPMWHLYAVRVPAEERRRLFETLRADGIGVQVNYIPVYWHPAFEDLGYRRGLCPVAEEWYRREISLPMHAGLSDSEVDLVIERVRKAFGS
ncbi:aminotransferase class V-fold PLP-dependent enzyme [Microbacterium sp. CFH 90308]|uniref:Aminotransferase class V-fold PLP-dependent enzyme n=1 Tax=Microbacterium salsuginis TaxID=2722803 RepID=A0ABX1KBD8_9MICO|nr:aminotransferase class V-fold PLP-dependent enzyme [Microbacterium sp. CFH 90308]NLP83945.1 aminotransferase class V-fold PLP-dependent enzyme [Microbacterium sp. CFH 90308]